MNPTRLYLDLFSKDDTHHHASLETYDRKTLAKYVFEYHPDAIIIPTESRRFNSRLGNLAERHKWIQAFGGKLYQRVFSQEMHTILQYAIRDTEWLQFVVRIDENAKRMAQIPWEFLHDGNDFLVTNKKMSLFRCLKDLPPQFLNPLQDDTLRVLCLLSNPSDLEDHERLNIDWEQERLLQVLDSSLRAGKVEVDFEDEATLPNLEASLNEGNYHILHYIGHAAFHPHGGGSLVLEDEQGKKQFAGLDTLQSVLQKGFERGLRLLFLAGCQTATTDENEGEAFSDLAQLLLKAGIPAVISMQDTITDETRIDLTRTFYRTIIRGKTVDLALNNARRHILLHRTQVVRGDFATPILFSTNTDCLRFNHTKDRTLYPVDVKIDSDPAYCVYLQQLGSEFVGRRREVRQIKHLFLQENVRAIMLHGFAKIGKTVTVTQIARRLRKSFQGVYAFDCATDPLSPEQIVSELHDFLITNGFKSSDELTHTPMSAVQTAEYLAQLLIQVPLLLIFDGMETLLENTTQRTIADPDVAAFFKTLLNATVDGTKFLFTSRYTFRLMGDERRQFGKPANGHRLQQVYHVIHLENLSRPEAILNMHKFPSLSVLEFRMKQEIYAKLGGHPYTLKVFAYYCQDKTPEKALGSLEKVTVQMVQLTGLEMIWEKLHDRTRTLLNRIAIFEKALPLAAIEWALGEEVTTVRAKIEELVHWGLVVQLTEKSYIVHSLVREFCMGKMEPGYRQRAFLEAAKFYLNEAGTLSDDSSSQVFTKLYARHLFLEAKAFEKAYGIVHEVETLLRQWGFISLAERLLKESVESLEGHSKAAALELLVRLYQDRKDYARAIEIYQQMYQIFEELNDQSHMAGVRHQLGVIHQARGENEMALAEYTASLQLKEAIGDQAGIADTRHQIGNVRRQQGKYEAALEEYTTSLQLKEALGDQSEIARTQYQIGNIYYLQGEYEAALRMYAMSLQIVESIGDQTRIIRIRHQIGNVYYFQRNYEKALREYIESLRIAEEVEDQVGIAQSWHQLGIIHQIRGEYHAAMMEYKKSLQVAEAIGDQAEIARTRHQIGSIHQARGEYEMALEEYTASLQLKEVLGDPNGIARTKGQLADIYEKREEYPQAFKAYWQTFIIFTRLQSPEVRIVVKKFQQLRNTWGAEVFDAAWQEAMRKLGLKG